MLDSMSHRDPAAPWNAPPWSCRARHVIKNAFGSDIEGKTVADLASLSRRECMNARNCGRRTVNEIAEVLASYGLSFRGEGAPVEPCLAAVLGEGASTPRWQPREPEVSDLTDEQLVMELLRRGYIIAHGYRGNGHDR
jgi:hypothetical protein